MGHDISRNEKQIGIYNNGNFFHLECSKTVTGKNERCSQCKDLWKYCYNRKSTFNSTSNPNYLLKFFPEKVQETIKDLQEKNEVLKSQKTPASNELSSAISNLVSKNKDVEDSWFYKFFKYQVEVSETFIFFLLIKKKYLTKGDARAVRFHDEVIHFAHSIQWRGGKSTLEFLRGKHEDTGKGGRLPMQVQDYSLVLPSITTLRNRTPFTTGYEGLSEERLKAIAKRIRGSSPETQKISVTKFYLICLFLLKGFV